jgi:dimethylglycine dehydrogenase
VEPQLAMEGMEFEVMIFGEMRAARIIADSIWDPSNDRLKA